MEPEYVYLKACSCDCFHYSMWNMINGNATKIEFICKAALKVLKSSLKYCRLNLIVHSENYFHSYY